MMRCDGFAYHAPKQIAEAVKILREEGPRARPIAGGTDLVPNMKRRHQTPAVLVSLRNIPELRGASGSGSPTGGTLSIGACATLSDVADLGMLPAAQRAVRMAAGKVATPHIRNAGTIGGNLCLDTRCTYYNQNYEWRRAIDFCKKAPESSGGVAIEAVADGTCWVAPGSPRCWAVSSSDCAPALIALGAEVSLVSVDGERRIPLAELYADDGMAYLTKRPDELLTAVHVPLTTSAWRSTYWKLRRRGSFDFPVLGVGAAAKLTPDGVVEEARVVLGAVASHPVSVDTSALIGQRLDEETITAFAAKASKPSKPLDNTDFHMSWRKRVTRAYIADALRELRGDDPASLGVLARTAARLLPVA